MRSYAHVILRGLAVRISRACGHGAPHLRVIGKIQEPRQDVALRQHGMI